MPFVNGNFVPNTANAAPAQQTVARPQVSMPVQQAAIRTMTPTATFAQPIAANRAAYAVAQPAYQNNRAFMNPAIYSQAARPTMNLGNMSTLMPYWRQQPPPQPVPPASTTDPRANGGRSDQSAQQPGPNTAPWQPSTQPAPAAPSNAPVPGQLPPGFNPGNQGGQYGPPQNYMPPMPQQSVEQSVQNGSPQSVSNFLSALNQVGAGNNNRFMNAPGQMGAGPQAGFQGFGVNGQQAYANPVYAGGAYNPGIGYQGNMASQYGNYGVGNGAYANGSYGVGNASTPGQYNFQAHPWAGGGTVQQNGTGGIGGNSNPAGYAQPGPWGNPGNAPPGTPGSNWGGGSSQDWQNYLFAQPGQEPSQEQGGAYYTPNAPGQQSQTGTDANGNPIYGGPTAVSDARAKTHVVKATTELEEFLNALGAYSYEYKDPKYGEGRRISPMAQELEQSKLGKEAISTNPEGYKQVDYGKLAGTQLAATAYLNQRMNELEVRLRASILKNVKRSK